MAAESGVNDKLFSAVWFGEFEEEYALPLQVRIVYSGTLTGVDDCAYR